MEYDAEMVRRLLDKSNDKSKRGGRTAAIVPLAVSDLAALKPEISVFYADRGRPKPISREIPQMKKAPRKRKGGFLGSLISGIGRVAARVIPRAIPAVVRAAPAVVRAAPAARAIAPLAAAAVKGISPTVAAAASRAATAARAAVAARGAAAPMSALAKAGFAFGAVGTGLGVAFPVYSILTAEKQAEANAAVAEQQKIQDALDRAQAKKDKDEADRLSSKYERDYDNDRAAAAAEKLAAQQQAADDAEAYAEAARLQQIQDAKDLEDYYAQLALEAEKEKAKKARDDAEIERRIQEAITAATRGMNPAPTVPANIPTPTNPRPTPSNPVITFPPSPPPPKKGRKGGRTAAPVRSMKDLRMDLLRLGYIM